MTRRPSISSPLFFVDRQLRSMHTAQWLIWLIRMWTNSRVVSGTPARLAASLATLLTACSASSAPGTLIAGLVIRGCIMLFSCHIDGVFRVTSVDTRARSDVTDGRARLAGPALRGRAGPPEGRGLPHAGIADRGGRRGPGRLAAPEPLRGGRRRQPPRLADHDRRARLPQHAALAQRAPRGAPGRPRPGPG